MLSIRFSLVLIAYSAVSFVALTQQTRLWVSVLSTVTVVFILYAILAAIVERSPRRQFWIGFALFAFGWLYLHNGHPNREFYSGPATATEYLAGPNDVYADLSSYDDPGYDGVSSASPRDSFRSRTAQRKRIRYIANCIAAIGLGVVGGVASLFMFRKSGASIGADEPGS